jgi:uncharacterized protein (UPF0548 family)
VPARISRSRRLATAARWPLGVALTSWRYLWRTTPLHRDEVRGSSLQDAAPPLPATLVRDELQLPEDGAGPFFHRRYRTRIREARCSPERLMALVTEDLDRVAPTEFASFHKVRGDAARMAVGDEYVVRMPGPWDGPVRVAEVTPTSFGLVTLAGHLEAGQIRFTAAREGDLLAFGIESWARSGDRLSDLLYDRLRMAKEIQVHMWTSLLERVAELAGGRMTGGIEIHTRRVAEPALLADLRRRPVSFELASVPASARGWHVDDVRQPLPKDGWEVAYELMRRYEVADPALVRAWYDADEPLEGRTMLLELRFWGLRFRVGVRVGAVYDEVREVDGRPVRVAGWSYRTVEGHLEVGELAWEVWKWQDTGAVEFRIHAISRASPARGAVVRLGFALFGRRRQLRFYRRAAARMASLTAAGLRQRSPAPRSR